VKPTQRPDIIANVLEAPREASCIRRTGELLGIVASLSERAGLRQLRIDHEVLPPGRRSSSPHAHTKREEFVYVLDGHPDVWIDGHLHPLRPGDFLAFAAGTGVAHTVINNSERDAILLAIATMPEDDACFYPFNPNAGEVPEEVARSWSARSRGPHDGRPSAFSVRSQGIHRT
jgi:uncharacterized cupin superfamily protein